MFQLLLLSIFREIVNFLACAAYALTYVVGILYIIKSIIIIIIIMNIECFSS
jgi:hypothetical protein